MSVCTHKGDLGEILGQVVVVRPYIDCDDMETWGGVRWPVEKCIFILPLIYLRRLFSIRE
jgi:hypothetical protein